MTTQGQPQYPQGPQYPPPAGPPPAPTPPRKRHRLATVLGVAAAFVLGIIIGSASAGSGTSSTAATAAKPAATVTVTAAAQPAPAVTVTVTATPEPPPAPAGPAVSFDDGTYVVGTDIAAGTYKTTAPVDATCYWKITKSGTNGSDIIKNDMPGGGSPTVVLTAGQDFKSSSCGTWAKQ